MLVWRWTIIVYVVDQHFQPSINSSTCSKMSKYLEICTSALTYLIVQMQNAATAHLNEKQLLLFFVEQFQHIMDTVAYQWRKGGGERLSSAKKTKNELESDRKTYLTPSHNMFVNSFASSGVGSPSREILVGRQLTLAAAGASVLHRQLFCKSSPWIWKGVSATL